MRSVLLAAALVAAPVVVGAEEALPIAGAWSTFSPDGRHVAVLDPARMETAVYRVDASGERSYVWSMPGWSARAALANGGDLLVVAPDEGGVVRSNWQPGDVVLRFYDRGILVKALTISELVPDATEMIAMESHFYWGRTRGFDAKGRYVVETVDHVWRFAPKTGAAQRD